MKNKLPIIRLPGLFAGFMAPIEQAFRSKVVNEGVDNT